MSDYPKDWPGFAESENLVRPESPLSALDARVAERRAKFQGPLDRFRHLNPADADLNLCREWLTEAVEKGNAMERELQKWRNRDTAADGNWRVFLRKLGVSDG